MPEELVGELDAARAAFLEALADVDEELATVPGVMEDWSVRDVVVHVAWWSQHGADAIDLATTGAGDEFRYSGAQTDAMNARILEEARTVAPADALTRESEAFAAFRERVAALEPSQLALRLGNGDTVEEVIRYDGPDHYAEHTEHLRAWFADDEGTD